MAASQQPIGYQQLLVDENLDFDDPDFDIADHVWSVPPTPETERAPFTDITNQTRAAPVQEPAPVAATFDATENVPQQRLLMTPADWVMRWQKVWQ